MPDPIAVPVLDWRDRGVAGIKDQSWCLYDDTNYDDTNQHRASGRHYLPKPARDEIGRWILFVQSDLEYTRLEFNFIQIVNWPMNLLTFGWWERHKQKRFDEFTTAGDLTVWPFASRADYEQALVQRK